MSWERVSLDEIRQLTADAKEEIWAAARANGREPKVYLHWTAGYYNSKYSDYHINIDGAGRFHIYTDNFAEVLPHTWKRNSGAIGIALCCCVDATSAGLGTTPPTGEQIEAMAQAIVAVCDPLWLTIDKAHVMTHGEAADNEDREFIHENYGPRSTCERWDLEYLGTPESPSFNPFATDGSRGGDVLRGKANWYRNEQNEEA